MRAGLYARVSTEEQTKDYSIDAQKRAFQALCQARQWEVYKEYLEEGRSARTEHINKRPVFREMIADALDNKFGILVVHKLDRFSRNLRLTLDYFEKLSKAGVTFISINEQMDFSQPWGKFALVMLGAMAQFYSDNLSEETKKGKQERKAQGLYLGLLPFGAMKGGDGVPVPNPDTYPGLIMAFELATQGKSDREVSIALNAAGYRTAGNQGNRPFNKDTVRGILQNRFYLGQLPDGNGGWIKGKHEPFIDKKLFDAVQEARAHRRHFRQKSIRKEAKTYSLSGLMWCQICSSKIRIQPGHLGRRRVFYSSRSKGLQCTFKSAYLDIYEAQIQWYLENFIIPDDYRKRVMEIHRQLESAYDDVGQRQKELGSYLERIREQYAWGHISKECYLAQYEEAEKQLKALVPMKHKEKSLEKLAHFLSNVAEAWKDANQELRNKLAKALFEKLWLENNRVVGIKPRDELRPFFQMSYEEFLKSSHVHTCSPSGSHVQYTV